ncbi:MAG TPA: winged helix-turn-helix domain-containing protein [Herpetosiphonaceae bacterium]
MGGDEDPNDEPNLAVLPASVPVEMPELPAQLILSAEEQLRAVMDPLRSRMLGVLLHQPLAAKQLADRLGVLPGSIGHHLRVLEAAGLVRAVARRQIRGTVATYYTRSARLFLFDGPPDAAPELDPCVHILSHLRNELAEAVAAGPAGQLRHAGFPHARISLERALEYERRFIELLDDFVNEPIDPAGQVYGLGGGMFVAPPYLQPTPPPDPAPDSDPDPAGAP